MKSRHKTPTNMPPRLALKNTQTKLIPPSSVSTICSFGVRANLDATQTTNIAVNGNKQNTLRLTADRPRNETKYAAPPTAANVAVTIAIQYHVSGSCPTRRQ